jgi:hypothetical protein
VLLRFPELLAVLSSMLRCRPWSSSSPLRYSGRLPPRFFIRLLPHCSRPRSRPLMPLLHSRPFQRLFPNVRPSGLLGELSSLFCPLRLRPAKRVTLLPAAVSLFRCPQVPWVRIFLKTFPLRHATSVRWDTFLQAAAIFLPDAFIWLSASSCS